MRGEDGGDPYWSHCPSESLWFIWCASFTAGVISVVLRMDTMPFLHTHTCTHMQHTYTHSHVHTCYYIHIQYSLSLYQLPSRHFNSLHHFTWINEGAGHQWGQWSFQNNSNPPHWFPVSIGQAIFRLIHIFMKNQEIWKFDFEAWLKIIVITCVSLVFVLIKESSNDLVKFSFTFSSSGLWTYRTLND